VTRTHLSTRGNETANSRQDAGAINRFRRAFPEGVSRPCNAHDEAATTTSMEDASA
jgi:hypothetical protein